MEGVGRVGAWVGGLGIRVKINLLNAVSSSSTIKHKVDQFVQLTCFQNYAQLNY